MKLLLNDLNFIDSIKGYNLTKDRYIIVDEPSFVEDVNEPIMYNMKFEKTNSYQEFDTIVLSFTDINIIKALANNFNKDIEPLYYKELYSRLEHTQYKIDSGWIESPRQNYILSEDCISIIQKRSTGINSYIRSSNIDNILYNDVCFLCTLVDKGELNIMISIPHTWGNNKNKIENNG